MSTNRRTFIKNTAAGAAGITLGTAGMSTRSYAKILGANDKVRVGIVGFSNRFKGSLSGAFMKHAEAQNFEFVAVSDIWNRRREEGASIMKERTGNDLFVARNNQELYETMTDLDAVVLSSADFQHALHLVQAVRAGCDVYCEKPLAETMPDNRAALKAVKDSGKIVQIGSQRRSGKKYHNANDYIRSGKFGKISMVEMTWNVNQPGRWRLPDLTSSIKESDTDWERYQMNRPRAAWDPRKYLEYRLFWPYSSGIPGQWMSHQIDTVHWFSGLPHPRSVTANGGIYAWKDGRTNFDTMTAVFDYGPLDDPSEGFQVIYSSRQHQSAGGTKEVYFSNGGMLNMQTGMVNGDGGMSEKQAAKMGMKENILGEYDLNKGAAVGDVVTSANTGVDDMTSNHMLNWMECVRSRETPNAPVEAGYSHSIANIMTTAALRTGKRVTFDTKTQNVLAGGEVFVYGPGYDDANGTD